MRFIGFELKIVPKTLLEFSGILQKSYRKIGSMSFGQSKDIDAISLVERSNAELSLQLLLCTKFVDEISLQYYVVTFLKIIYYHDNTEQKQILQLSADIS